VTPLDDFANTYLATRATKLKALAAAAEEQGDLELAKLFQIELERKLDILGPPPHLRVVEAAPETRTAAQANLSGGDCSVGGLLTLRS